MVRCSSFVIDIVHSHASVCLLILESQIEQCRGHKIESNITQNHCHDLLVFQATNLVCLLVSNSIHHTMNADMKLDLMSMWLSMYVYLGGYLFSHAWFTSHSGICICILNASLAINTILFQLIIRTTIFSADKMKKTKHTLFELVSIWTFIFRTWSKLPDKIVFVLGFTWSVSLKLILKSDFVQLWTNFCFPDFFF